MNPPEKKPEPHDWETKVRLTDTDGARLVRLSRLKGVPAATLARMFVKEALAKYQPELPEENKRND